MVYSIIEVINRTSPIIAVPTVNIPRPRGIILVALNRSNIQNNPATDIASMTKPGIPINDRGRLIVIYRIMKVFFEP